MKLREVTTDDIAALIEVNAVAGLQLDGIMKQRRIEELEGALAKAKGIVETEPSQPPQA